MVDFDICKIPSKRHKEVEITNELKRFNNFTLPNKAMIGTTHQNRIFWWLSNLHNSNQIMHLTIGQKTLSFLPFKIRRVIRKLGLSLNKRINIM